MKYHEPESSQLEFKQEIPKNDQITKTAIAFCNTLGGKIIIGIEDDGTIAGISENAAQAMLESLDKKIYESCTPPIIPLIYQQRLNNKVLVIIEISPGMNKPYYLTAQGLSEGVFVRLGRSTMKASADMIEELKWQSRGLSYDKQPVYQARYADLSLSKIESFLAQRRNGRKTKIDKTLLTSYHILIEQHGQFYPTVAGILLFSDNPQQYFPENYILCSQFSGNKGRDALASRHCTGTLIEQFDAAYDFIVNRLSKSFVIKNKQRQEIYEIPTIAIREALMNAVLHRNYHINAPIKVAMYNNRIEIFSPGTFSGPIHLSDLETGITYIRNTAIAKMLWESRYVEKMGSGFIEIFESYRQAGLLKPEVEEGTNFIKCILPRIKALTLETQQDASQKVIEMLNIINEISRSDIVTKLKISPATAGRILVQLVKQNKLQQIGKGRAVKYQLK